MASESINKPMNGNYGSQQPYNVPEPPLSSEESNGTASISTTGAFSEDNGSPPNAVNSSTTGTSEGNGSVPKDEVGWYFVEQYYTTLSKHPDRLHVRSQTIFRGLCAINVADAVIAFLFQTIPICIRY